ncbi:MAG: ATP-dependent helicase [Phototrophicaceae bacterium]|jgi:DNA helicase-2/ATP-dependent DNA helicase PcrA
MSEYRKSQQTILNYQGGWMGVLAVPGAGKTYTLSALAAKLLSEVELAADQEILVVTLVRAAVGNFSQRIQRFLGARGGLTVGLPYRVRTLHGLANDIVRERPDLVQLDEQFTIVDERESTEILAAAVTAWLRTDPDVLHWYVDEAQLTRREVMQRNLPELFQRVAGSFIKQAKDATFTPEALEQALRRFQTPLPLAQMGAAIYARYQQGLNYRGGVDFQDLNRLALRALLADPTYLARLRHRWPYILEDEAQDSSQLQERLLRLLAEGGNWVRVGDPNQAIYETFTTANPKYLRAFVAEDGVTARDLPESGRSQASIQALANWLIEWSQRSHPSPEVRRKAPLTPPLIRSVAPDDPQPNPPNVPSAVILYPKPFKAEGAEGEIETIAFSVQRWLRENPDRTAAILVPRNERGTKFVDVLRQLDVPVVELLSSSASTREVARRLLAVLRALSNPLSAPFLADLYRALYDETAEDQAAVNRTAKLISTCRQVEAFLYPQGIDWLDEVIPDDPDFRTHLDDFRKQVQDFHAASLLPIDQLVLTIANRIFTESAALAVTFALAQRLRQESFIREQNQILANNFVAWSLADYAKQLEEIVRNQRRLLEMGEESSGFDPDKHVGKVTVATMHAAKGLEWDRVYLTSVNTYDFPSNDATDHFQGESGLVRDQLNLDAEALGQLATLMSGERYIEGQPTQAARIDYVSERLRLLYVGITRARRELVITWNTGRHGDQREALPLVALRTYWEQREKP